MAEYDSNSQSYGVPEAFKAPGSKMPLLFSPEGNKTAYQSVKASLVA